MTLQSQFLKIAQPNIQFYFQLYSIIPHSLQLYTIINQLVMSLEEKDQKIAQLTAELEKKHQDHEEFMNECKSLEQLLETQNTKKEAEIKKLKSEALQREKTIRDAQAQEKELTKKSEEQKKEIQDLKQKLSSYTQGSSAQDEQFKRLEAEIKKAQTTLQEQKQENKKLQQTKNNIQKQNNSIKQAQKKLRQQLNATTNQLKQTKSMNEQFSSQIQSLKNQLVEKSNKQNLGNGSSPSKIKDDSGKLKQQISSLKKQLSDLKKVGSKDSNNVEVTNLKQDYKKAQKQIDFLRSQISRLKQSQHTTSKKVYEVDTDEYKKLERTCKELKIKLGQLTQQKNYLQQSFKMNEIKSTKDLSPHKFSKQKNITFDVFLTTKKHYVSPFLQFNGKIVRVLKQNRNSFEKCLGSLKYTVDNISFDPKQISKNAIRQIIMPFSDQKKFNQEKGFQGEEEHKVMKIQQQFGYQKEHKTKSFIIIGAKHTSKKLIFSQAVEEFVEKLKNQANELDDTIITFVVYKNKLNQIPADVSEQYSCKISQIDEIFKKSIGLVCDKEVSSPKKKLIKQKQKPKSQVRYISVSIGDKLTVQFITSSNLSQIRQSDKLLNSLQNIIFHHLPFPSEVKRQYHCVLTINPIVQQYENCRLSLSLVNQPFGQRKEEPEFQPSSSPLKDQFISDTVKRRIQSCQKQTEQQSLKVQRMQNEIQFYRSRVQEVLLRVKNTISVQGKQTPYLKKSPIVLTLQKLEKSLLAILQRSTNRSKRNEGEKEDNYEQEQYQNNEENGEQENGQQLQELL